MYKQFPEVRNLFFRLAMFTSLCTMSFANVFFEWIPSFSFRAAKLHCPLPSIPVFIKLSSALSLISISCFSKRISTATLVRFLGF